MIIAIFFATQGRTAGHAGGQGRVEGAKVGSEDFGAAQDEVEIFARHRLATAPASQLAVAPEDGVFAIEKNHSVGHSLQNLLVLKQLAYLEGLFQMFAGDENAVETLVAQPGQGTHGVLCQNHLVLVGRWAQQAVDVIRRITDKQDFRFSRQLPSCSFIKNAAPRICNRVSAKRAPNYQIPPHDCQLL